MKKSIDKTPKPEKQRGKYEEKLNIKGSFLDIIAATVKDANNKTADEKKNKPKP